jgi:hypothetical protein
VDLLHKSVCAFATGVVADALAPGAGGGYPPEEQPNGPKVVPA